MADSPKAAEAAQALFCAMADYIGSSAIDKKFSLKTYPTYTDFKQEYAKLIKALWTSNTPIEPRSFHELIQRVDSKFSGFDQHDAQEQRPNQTNRCSNFEVND